MNEIIPVGDTPIFDQLVRELALRGKSYENMTADAPIDLRPVEKPFNRLKRPAANNTLIVEMKDQEIPKETVARQIKLYSSLAQFAEEAPGSESTSIPTFIEPKSVGDGTTILFREVVRPLELEMEATGGWAAYLNKVVTETCEKHPQYTSVTVETQDEFDGTVTLRVTGVETANDVTPEPADESDDDDLNEEDVVYIGPPLWKIPNEE